MHLAQLHDGALAATKRYILVDKSNITGYPHRRSTAHLILAALSLRAVLITGGAFTVKVGLVYEADATDGSVQWLLQRKLQGASAVEASLDFRGLNGRPGLSLDHSGTAPLGFISNAKDVDQTWLQTDAANLTDAAGNTDASAGAGDIVVEVKEDTDGGTLDLDLEALYEAVSEQT